MFYMYVPDRNALKERVREWLKSIAGSDLLVRDCRVRDSQACFKGLSRGKGNLRTLRGLNEINTGRCRFIL